MKYNLTLLQQLELIPMGIFWLLADPKERKTWHEVKKGMEKHEHKYTIMLNTRGRLFLQCEHEGCDLCEPVEKQS